MSAAMSGDDGAAEALIVTPSMVRSLDTYVTLLAYGKALIHLAGERDRTVPNSEAYASHVRALARMRAEVYATLAAMPDTPCDHPGEFEARCHCIDWVASVRSLEESEKIPKVSA